MTKRFYINTSGNDDEAYRFAIEFACKLANNESNIQKIILYIANKQSTGWFERIYNKETVKKLFNGIKFENCPAIFKFETIKTIKKIYSDVASTIVISCGMNSNELFEIDEFQNINYIIAIPWLFEATEKWIRTWHAINLENKKADKTYPEPNCIIKTALKELTDSINITTGIQHSLDEHRAKTYLRALHKYEEALEPEIISAYLIRELNWTPDHAFEVEKLINMLNSGKHFKGGEKNDLQYYYKNWQEKCKK